MPLLCNEGQLCDTCHPFVAETDPDFASLHTLCLRRQAITLLCFLVVFLMHSGDYSVISVMYKYKYSAMLSSGLVAIYSSMVRSIVAKCSVFYNSARLY